VIAALAAGVCAWLRRGSIRNAAAGANHRGVSIRKVDNGPIRTIDHYVHHVSTVDANYGKHVKLSCARRFDGTFG